MTWADRKVLLQRRIHLKRSERSNSPDHVVHPTPLTDAPFSLADECTMSGHDEERVEALKLLLGELQDPTISQERLQQIEAELTDFKEQPDSWQQCVDFVKITDDPDVLWFAHSVFVRDHVTKTWVAVLTYFLVVGRSSRLTLDGPLWTRSTKNAFASSYTCVSRTKISQCFHTLQTRSTRYTRIWGNKTGRRGRCLFDE